MFPRKTKKYYGFGENDDGDVIYINHFLKNLPSYFQTFWIFPQIKDFLKCSTG